MLMPDSWRRCTLRDVTVRPAIWNPRHAERDRIRYVDVSGIDRDTLSIVTETSIACGEAPSRARKLVQTGDTIFATVRPSLKRIAQVPASMNDEVVSTAFCVLRPDLSKVDPEFLFFAAQLDSVMSGVTALETGASYPAVRDSDILDQPIPVPDLAEQRKIAALLNSVRDAMLHECRYQENAIHLRRAAMQSLYTKGVRNEAQKETEIGPVPASWSVVNFSVVRDWLQYGTSAHCTYEPTQFPVLRIPNIESGRVDRTDIKFAALSPADADKFRLCKGDLIFIRTNGVIDRLGTCAVYTGEPDGALFASYLIRARLKLDRVNPYFAAYFFGSETGTSIIAGRASPAADGKFNLNTGTIDSLPLPLPPTLDEQNEIVSILNAIDHKIDLHKRKRMVFDELFDTLLHKLMTGEIRVDQLDLPALSKLESVPA